MRRINKILTLMAVCGLCAAGGHQMFAETVSQKEAKSMAQKFFNESRNYVTTPVSYVYNGKDLTTQRLFTPFYVFNSPSGGFVIVSADNKAFPILAYSLNANFNKDRISPDVRSVLEEFSRDVELIRYDSRIPSDAIAQWSSYSDLIFDVLKNTDNKDFYAVPFDDRGGVCMVRRTATEFDFENNQPVEYGLPKAEPIKIELPDAPAVVSNGAGHFALSLQDAIERAIVYDISGSIVEHKTYKHTNIAHIDLAAHPNGFYIALLIDKSGICHAAKLYR